jgi:hypothetical protein
MGFAIRNRRNFYAGLLFSCFGVFAFLMARDYPMGTAVRMGAGYFPSILGGLLALLGAGIAVHGVWSTSSTVKRMAFRPLLLVLGAVLAFALLLDRAGLVLATFALIFISCLGGWQFRQREALVLFFCLIALARGIFHYGLGMFFKVWP